MDEGWVLGFVIGGLVVLIVVTVVSAIVWLASQIRDRAHRAVHQLTRVEAATAPLWDVETTAAAANGLANAAGRLRERERSS